MIILRQKEFGDNDQQKQQQKQQQQQKQKRPQEEITPEKLKKEKDVSFNAGVEQGRKEANEAAQRASEERAEIEKKAKEKSAQRAERLRQVEEYTGLDDLKKWGKKKKDAGKEFIKSHKKEIRTGFKIGVPVVLASGLTYGGIKAYKHYKNKSDAEKKSEDIRKKVRGYDNKEKK